MLSGMFVSWVVWIVVLMWGLSCGVVSIVFGMWCVSVLCSGLSMCVLVLNMLLEYDIGSGLLGG